MQKGKQQYLFSICEQLLLYVFVYFAKANSGKFSSKQLLLFVLPRQFYSL